MGLLQTPPPEIKPAPASATDPSAWLDDLLANMATGPKQTWAPEAATRHLSGIQFETIISAVERAGPKASHAAAIALYQHWIDANPASPFLWAANFNLGSMCQQDSRTDEAAAAYNQAIQLRPDMPCTAINLGLLQENAGQPELALATWRRATQPDESRVALQIQQGRLLEKIGRLAEAEQMLRRVLLTDTAQPDVIHHFIHLRQKTCLWPAIPTDIPGLPPSALTEHTGPLGLLALTDDIDTQIRAGQNWVARKTTPAPEKLAPPHPYSHPRIRIGYLSSDFCSHAMSYLIAELLERQDRSRFDLYGYCASREDGSDIRRRVLAAFNHRRFIASLTDEQAARLIRADEIDILIDLNGITEGSRLALLRWRPAPIQATYLGFIGPVPLPELDYLLCDNLVIPPEHAPRYQPTPLPIGPIYQANDSKRTTGPKLTRAEAGLPDHKFIFTCVSKHYKITEPLFAAWMTILHQVENAVLWLIKDNPYSEANLIAEARRAHIAPERIIISDRANPDIYLSRLALADLFLDTFPYNAGTVASDAIRMELPLITLCGTSFASRMATSLLNAIGATQGITTSLPKYIATAIHLAQNPQAYAAFKTHFTAQRWNQTIGNIERFTTAFDDTLYNLVTTQKPSFPTDLFAKALALHNAGQLHEAAAAYRCVLALSPNHASALLNLGSVQLALNETQAGAETFHRLTQLDPDNATAHGNLAKSFHDLGRIPEAFASYRTALKLAPQNPDILMNFGAALMEAKCWADAITVTRHALAIRPNNAMAHTNLATALYSTGRLDESLQSCQNAMALNPEPAIINATLGGLLLELGQLAGAKTLCERALTADPNLPNAHFNLSHALKGMNNLPAAVQSARRAIALNPNVATYHFHLAHTLLLQGNLDEGWEEYEWRWRLPNFTWAQTIPSLLSKPGWLGEDIASKTLLIFTEQGLGDIVQFTRYIPLAATRAARTIVAAQPHLHALLKTMGDVEIVSILDPLPAFDIQCPLMSLPRAFQTRLDSIPSAVPYLHAPPEAKALWRLRLKTKNLRVGLVWAGNPDTQRDRFRSPRLASLAPLFDTPGIDFYALQLGPGRQDIVSHPLPPNVTDLGVKITNLTDTAAIMSNLDLMISSCTGPLHLAGALAAPTWAILPFAPHFCWLLGHADTAWYPTMRLYRQDEYGQDWSGVVARIAADLTLLVKTKSKPPTPPEN